jgi:uncharacterized protein (DUF1697 family)
MRVLISFLRGLNMTGHNSMKMTDLAELYKIPGHKNITTYIQSGNVIFDCENELPESVLSIQIEDLILEKFSYKVPVMIRTVEEMRQLIVLNPFLAEAQLNPEKMAVILLHEEATKAQIQKVIDIDYPPDKFKIIGREIYIFCPIGFGKTKLYTNFFENKMGVTGTARNWKTITKLLEIAEN